MQSTSRIQYVGIIGFTRHLRRCVPYVLHVEWRSNRSRRSEPTDKRKKGTRANWIEFVDRVCNNSFKIPSVLLPSDKDWMRFSKEMLLPLIELSCILLDNYLTIETGLTSSESLSFDKRHFC